MVQNDRYFGFEDTAVFCQTYIHSLFAPGPAPGVEAKAIPPHLGEFIAYALYRTRLPVAITHQALLLLARLKARYPSARGTSTSPHRLFLSSLMLSSKISLDDSFSNASWTIVGQGLFELREVNQMERELFAFLGWNVVVRDEELAQWTKDVYEPYQAARDLVAAETAPVAAAPAVAPVASTSNASAPRTSMEDRKRRRDVVKADRSASADSRSSSVDSIASTSSATSSSTRSSSCGPARSPSPDELRHRRASDAALAILHGPGAVAGSIGGAGASRSTRARARTPSPYSTHSRPSSHSSSASSSMLCSPVSGATTPGSPGTPCSAGPATPDHKHQPVPAMNWGAYAFPAKAAPEAAYQPTNDSISVASW